jgi:hypothetical protein
LFDVEMQVVLARRQPARFEIARRCGHRALPNIAGPLTDDVSRFDGIGWCRPALS